MPRKAFCVNCGSEYPNRTMFHTAQREWTCVKCYEQLHGIKHSEAQNPDY